MLDVARGGMWIHRNAAAMRMGSHMKTYWKHHMAILVMKSALLILLMVSNAYSATQQVLHDKDTGLMWLPCPIGYTFQITPAISQYRSDEIGCKSNTSSIVLTERDRLDTGSTWFDAFKAAEDLEYAGYSDWRLPNSDEILALGSKKNCNASGECNFILDKDLFTIKATYWTAVHANRERCSDGLKGAEGKSICFVSVRIDPDKTTKWEISEPTNRSLPVIAVRGGTPDELYGEYKKYADEHFKKVELATGNSPQAVRETEGIWTDKSTGLTWLRCPMGSTVVKGSARKIYGKSVSSECKFGDVSTSYKTWFDAVIEADAATLHGFDDWRLPTHAEIQTLIGRKALQVEMDMAAFDGVPDDGSCRTCIKDVGSIPAAGNIWLSSNSAESIESCNTAEPGRRYWSKKQQCEPSIFIDEYGDTRTTASDIRSHQAVLLVRGGKPFDATHVISRARESKQLADSDAIIEKRMADEAERIENERRIAAANEAQRRAEEERRKTKEYHEGYKRRTELLRKTVKPGDMSYQGLVIDVDGELILVQTYCTRNGISKPCGSEWVRRSDLLPGGPLR
jgi:hypothetical protein